MRYGIKIIFLFFTLVTFLGCSRLPTSSTKKGKLYTLAFYNVEDLYDTQNDPNTDDDAYTPTGIKNWTDERYEAKLKNIAQVIDGIGGDEELALTGISEVENKQVVEELVNTSPLRKHKLGVVHFDMPDAQGLDIALLYNPKHFKPTSTDAIKINFEGKNYSSRDILRVRGELRGERVTVYVNHWPSNGLGNGRQSESRLRSAATTLRREITNQQAADPNAKIIVMGDFGTEPSAAAMEKVLKATGRPDPTYKEELYNTHYLTYVNGRGSYAAQGDFRMSDQILVSKSLLLDESGLQFVRGSAGIHDAPEAKFLFGKYRDTPRRTWSGNLYLGGYSDHFPVYIQLRRER
jgi:hypothetical protein